MLEAFLNEELKNMPMATLGAQQQQNSVDDI